MTLPVDPPGIFLDTLTKNFLIKEGALSNDGKRVENKEKYNCMLRDYQKRQKLFVSENSTHSKRKDQQDDTAS